MQKITTLLAALALTTSCSLQLDSQYGLRWDRRVYAPQNDDAAVFTPEVADEHAAASLEVTSTAKAPLHAESFTVQTDQLPTNDPIEITESTSTPEALYTYWTAVEPETHSNTNPASSIADAGQTIELKLGVTDNIVFKVLATLALLFVVLILALYGFIALLITDWTSTTGYSDGWGIGTIGYPRGILTMLITGSGIWLCISLIKKLWTKKSNRKSKKKN